MTYGLKLREDRMALPDERRRLVNALKAAKEKLQLYRALAGSEYIGGMEYTALMKLIDEALQ